MNKNAIVLILFIVIVVGVLMNWFIVLEKFKRGRKKYTIDQLYREYSLKSMDREKFGKIMKLVGECYNINVCYLRPADEFGGNLLKIEACMPGGGAEDLEKELENKMKIKVDFKEGIRTIQDLMSYCEAHIKTP